MKMNITETLSRFLNAHETHYANVHQLGWFRELYRQFVFSYEFVFFVFYMLNYSILFLLIKLNTLFI